MDDAPTPEPTFEDGQRLQAEGRWAEALGVYRGLARRFMSLNLAIGLSACLQELGEFAEAEHWILLAARHRPLEPALRLRLGAICQELGQLERGELELRTALALRPEDDAAKLALAGLLLTQGRYAEGWPLMEARVRLHERVVPRLDGLPYPEWTGQPLDGKAVLVGVEQGLGDQIQMARFAQGLKARGASRVTLACRSPLAPLLATAPGVDATIALDAGKGATVPQHDYWTRYFSLPHRLGATLETLPRPPYLFADPARKARWAPRARVGLAWQANATGFNVAAKSLPPPLAQRLLDAGVMSLQPEDTGVADMADTAAIIDQLDLVVAIDTAVAHLAGAMGKPCWTLIPALRTDWRWMHGRADSPWYPSMRLYRQAKPFDWAPEVDQVLADLKAQGFIG